MNHLLRPLSVFSTVVNAGSFTKAAKELGLTPTAVSQQINKLEDALDTTLLYRSTRSISLTEDGKQLAFTAAKMVDTVRSGLEQVTQKSETLKGRIRITMPAFRGQDSLTQLIWDFGAMHPQVEMEITFSDRQRNLTEMGIDVAFRFGILEDSAMIARKVSDFKLVYCCAPALLERQPCNKIDQIEALDFIAMGGGLDRFEFTNAKMNKVTIQPQNARILVNSVIAAHGAMLSGLGARAMPLDLVRNDLAAGRLVHLCQDWSLPLLGIYAVRPKNARSSALSAQLIAHVLANRHTLG